MLDSNIINLVNSFVLDFNKNYKFIKITNELDLRKCYEIDFFENLNKNKYVPAIGECLWFSYLLDIFLRKNNLNSNICLIKLLDGNHLKIHFQIKLNYLGDVFYLDYFNSILRISKYSDLIIKVKKNLKFKDFVDYNYTYFSKEIMPSLFEKSLSDWDFNLLILNLNKMYNDSNFKMNFKPEIKLEVYN